MLKGIKFLIELTFKCMNMHNSVYLKLSGLNIVITRVYCCMIMEYIVANGFIKVNLKRNKINK
jgi:hypothetical protein